MAKQNCLIVLSASPLGVSAPSFLQCYKLTQSAFNIEIATPETTPLEEQEAKHSWSGPDHLPAPSGIHWKHSWSGPDHLPTFQAAPPVFIDKDDQSSRWLNDIAAKNLLEPRSLSDVQGGQYSCVVVPHSPGASEDLASFKVLGKILTHCLAERKPVCAIGLGVCALLSAMKGEPQQWAFRDIALTGSSLAEVTTASYFSSLPLIPGDAILDRAGIFSTGAPSSIHIVVNAGVVTGQNPQSTLSAVQNMILLANQRQSKGK